MTRLKITCESCGQAWMVAKAFSVYEQQALESCPCPTCGAYTLCCHEPVEPPLVVHERTTRRRPRVAVAR